MVRNFGRRCWGGLCSVGQKAVNLGRQCIGAACRLGNALTRRNKTSAKVAPITIAPTTAPATATTVSNAKTMPSENQIRTVLGNVGTLKRGGKTRRYKKKYNKHN